MSNKLNQAILRVAQQNPEFRKALTAELAQQKEAREGDVTKALYNTHLRAMQAAIGQYGKDPEKAARDLLDWEKNVNFLLKELTAAARILATRYKTITHTGIKDVGDAASQLIWALTAVETIKGIQDGSVRMASQDPEFRKALATELKEAGLTFTWRRHMTDAVSAYLKSVTDEIVKQAPMKVKRVSTNQVEWVQPDGRRRDFFVTMKDAGGIPDLLIHLRGAPRGLSVREVADKLPAEVGRLVWRALSKQV